MQRIIFFHRFTLIIMAALVAWLAPCRAKAETLPSNRPIRFVLVGDSTVAEKSGWGPGFAQLLTQRATCTNTAAGGRSSKSFIGEGKWEKALALRGDYYLIQFGHNDEPGKGADRETQPHTTYREFMARYVDEARAIGAKPVLITSLTRRQFDKSGGGKIVSSLTPYVDEVKKLAAEKKVPLVDLHALSIAVCEKLGPQGCLAFSPHKTAPAPNTSGTNQVDSPGPDDWDHTHLNAKGSVLFGRIVAEELVRVAPELAPCFHVAPAAVKP